MIPRGNQTTSICKDSRFPRPKFFISLASFTEKPTKRFSSFGIAPCSNNTGRPNPVNVQSIRHGNEQAATVNLPWRSTTLSVRERRAGKLPRISRSSCCSRLTPILRTARSGRSEGLIQAGSVENQLHPSFN
ncbi:hypothetical protein BS78_08G004200 [Paspalum vaginatum]|nr:hypothetical protein BS78_08G004200 [Paspalum vaginatum]